MNIVVVTEPTVEPVTLADIYLFLRLDPTGSPDEHPDDTLLTSLIVAARQKVEQVTRRALVPQRLRLILPRFPRSRVFFGGTGMDADDYEYREACVELKRPPLVEFHSVTYYDESNVQQTLDAARYFVSEQTLPPKLEVAEGYDWPLTFARADAVQIEYTAGYDPIGSPASDEASGVPDSLKTAIKLEVQLNYDPMTPEQKSAHREAIDRLLASYRVHTF